MRLPATTVYARPGWNSYAWSYADTGLPTAAGERAIVAVAIAVAPEQQLVRGAFQVSVDGGRSWSPYALGSGAFLPASALWRFADQTPSDTITPGSFTLWWQLADGSTVSSPAAVVVDNPPAGLAASRDTVLATLANGALVSTLAPIDTGAPEGGRWVLESQSQPGLFAVTADPVTGAAQLVVADARAMPAAGTGVSVDLHYVDRYQLDVWGNPVAGQGVSRTVVFGVVDGVSQDLTGFGPDLVAGTAAGAASAPAVARLADGGFVVGWTAADGALWARTGDALGQWRGAAQPLGTGAAGAPALAALAGGGWAVAYTEQDGAGSHLRLQLVNAAGQRAALWSADADGAAMPALTTFGDGGVALGWCAGGLVHVQQLGADGAPHGAEQVLGAFGTASSPALVALASGGVAAVWGERADGNVYVAINGGPARPVSSDGAAASLATAAPLPRVAALAGGGFVVAWDSYHNDTRAFALCDIFFQRYDDQGMPLGSLTQANLDSGARHFGASVAALPDGGFVIGWQAEQGDFDGNGVFGRRFGADGAAIDAHEFEINQWRAGDQSAPQLAAVGNGGFVASWLDLQEGGARIEARVLPGLPGAPPGSGQAGGSGATVAGTAGNNLLTATPGTHVIDTGAGIDTIRYGGARSGYSVGHDGQSVLVSDAAGTVHDTLLHVERLQFGDAWLALDVDGAAGSAYRLYQAAFDRAPDAAGLGFWMHALDHGAALDAVAAGFVDSQEFASLYGAQPSDAQFVEALYRNVLHRAAEGAGFAYWLTGLQDGAARATVLTLFSESAENQAQVIGSIQDGMAFLPWG